MRLSAPQARQKPARELGANARKTNYYCDDSNEQAACDGNDQFWPDRF